MPSKRYLFKKRHFSDYIITRGLSKLGIKCIMLRLKKNGETTANEKAVMNRLKPIAIMSFN